MAGTPKWMVYRFQTLLNWMIWGPTPIFGNTQVFLVGCYHVTH